MKTSLLFVAGLITVAACSNSSSKTTERWDPSNEPGNMSSSFERNISRLPTSGQLSIKPWSDSYWPSQAGGIADRWQTNDNSFSYSSPSREMLKSMSEQQIAVLSPAEKYDIFMGRYNYPTVQSERSRTSPSAPSWEGICHGWAPASVVYKEPQPVKLTNSDGITISFGSSDIKALLSFYQGQVAAGRASFIGQRCNVDLSNNPSAGRSAECRDTNAGSFHIALANQIGRFKQGFIVDITRDLEVWNQPVHSFSSSIDTTPRSPSLGAAPGTVKEFNVTTRMTYGVETQATWRAFGDGQALSTRTYQYRLELDANNQIIGGEWLTEDRPDFMWIQSGVSQFSGSFSGLNALYAASTNGVVQPTPVPTVHPTVQPTVAPTTRPTVQPTAQPTRAPVGGDGSAYCPAGFKPIAVAGGSVCLEQSNGIRVHGPFPREMADKCKATYFAAYCSSKSWPLEQYQQFRGNGVCPLGSNMDSTGVCVDNTGFAYGPFSNDLVSRCVSAGFGAKCQELVWNYGMVSQLQ